MDLHGLLNERRRKRRGAIDWHGLSALIPQSKTASAFDLSKNDQEPGELLRGRHPGLVAMDVVREAFAELKIPTEVQLSYAGMKRESGHGAFAMDEGYVLITAELSSMSGPHHFVDVPVRVTQGRALSPSVLVYDGVPRVLAQHAVDDILSRGEFVQKMPNRKNMFGPPVEGAQEEVPRVFAPMYARAFYSPQVTGIVPPGLPGPEVPGAAGSHLDVAERPVADMLVPSQKVVTNREIEVRTRGGAGYLIPKGTEGFVEHDVDGADRAYVVRFPSLGYAATVAKAALG